jgi:diacylglycerol kinase (ATP)
MSKNRPLYKSIGYALCGFWTALKKERNMKIHAVAALLAVGAGIYLGLTAVEWGLIVLAIGMVLAAELLNTGMEYICDEVTGGRHSEVVKNCKDISAAAVLVTAVAALIIGVIILIIPLVQKIF